MPVSTTMETSGRSPCRTRSSDDVALLRATGSVRNAATSFLDSVVMLLELIDHYFVDARHGLVLALAMINQKLHGRFAK